jgi:hypothetical protein
VNILKNKMIKVLHLRKVDIMTIFASGRSYWQKPLLTRNMAWLIFQMQT